MEIITLIAIFSFVESVTSTLSKCCPLNFELSVNSTSSKFARDDLSCQPSTSGTLGVTYITKLNMGLPECQVLQLVDAYDHSQKVSCVDRVSQRNDVFGVKCADREPFFESFYLPSIVDIRKCCPLNRKYDAEKQFCWNPYSQDDSSSTNDLLKISIRRSDLFVNASVGTPNCRDTHVLLDTVVPYKQVTFLFDSIVFTDSTADDVKLAHDEFCIDLVDNLFEYVVVRSCKSYFTTCNRGNRACIRKCCDPNFEIQNRTCVPSKRPLLLTFHNVSRGAEGYVVPQTSTALVQPAIIYGDICKEGKYMLNENDPDDKHVLTTTGNVFMLATNKVRDLDEYCLENMKSYSKTLTLVCLHEMPKIPEIVNWVKPTLMAACAAVSAFFLALTFAIYFMLPSLKNQHGRLIMCYLVTSALSYVTVVAQQTLHLRALSMEACDTVGYVMLFTFLSSFGWLNIISYDIWSTFKAVRSTFFKKSKTCKRFSMCCLYGWGYPLIWTGLTAVCQFTSLMKDVSLWKPDIGKTSCWFTNYGRSKIVFYIVPVSTMISFNIVIFIFTVKYCSNIRSDLKMSNNNYSLKKYNTDKNELMINMKLFIIMGINWTMELMSLMVQPHNRIFFIVSDLMNALGGAFVFCIFVLKPKVLHDLRAKIFGKGPNKRILERATGFTTSTSSSIILNNIMNHSRRSVSNIP